MNPATHNNDFYAWTQEQAHLLRTKQFNQIDFHQIAEEIEDMGRSEKRELESRLEPYDLTEIFTPEFLPSEN